MGGFWPEIFLIINIFVLGVLIVITLLFFRAQKKADSKTTHQPLLPNATWQKIVSDAEKEYKKTISQANLELQRELHTTTSNLHKKATSLSLKIITEEFSRYKNDVAKIHKENTKLLRDSANDVASQGIELRTNLINRQAKVEEKLQAQQNKLETYLTDRGTQLEGSFKKREDDFLQKIDSLEEKLVANQRQYIEKQAILNTNLEKDAEARRNQRLGQIDTALDNAITTFMSENLGTEVDLGAQLPHLVKTLQENKEEIKKELR